MSYYQVDVLCRDERGNPKDWGVKEQETGAWVCAHDEQGDPTVEPLSFTMRGSAEDWVRRQRYLNEIGRRG